MDKHTECISRRIYDTCVSYGDFTLASGKKSDYYVDLRKFTFSSDVGALFSLIQKEIKDINYEAIGGPAIGALPIATMFITRLTYENINKIGFAVRSGEKKHGMQNLIEGPIRKFDRVIVLEDVTTSGNSGLQAVKALQEYGCEVQKVITVVDRLQGGAELYAKHKIPFSRLFTIQDILVHHGKEWNKT